MRSQTAIFSRLVRDFMRRDPMSVPLGTPVGEAVAGIAARQRSCAVVIDSMDRPAGILTEQDITRRATFRVAPTVAVDEVMTAPVMTIADGEYLFHAIARMRRRGLRHMPVVDGDGVLVGILDLHDAIAVAAARLMTLIDRLTHEGTLESLKGIKAAQVQLAEELFEDQLPAPEIQAFLTRVNNDIHRRLVDAAVRDMAAEGWGEPPVSFCALVMGSGGRGENYLFPDQDNGFILADYPDSEHTRIDHYFIELAERLTGDLDAVGFPYCNGYCMAVNPLWRKTLGQWFEQLALWGRKRTFVAIRLADIFFDFQPVWGDVSLAARLRRRVTEAMASMPAFLQMMFHEEADHNVGLGFFGRLMTERDKAAYKGQTNLKYLGLIPLVEAARLLALREGVEETSTLGRLRALHEGGALDGNERDALVRAFTLLTELLLRRQIADFQAGRPVGYYVDQDALTRRQHKDLVEGLRAIDGLRKRIRIEFTAEIF